MNLGQFFLANNIKQHFRGLGNIIFGSTQYTPPNAFYIVLAEQSQVCEVSIDRPPITYLCLPPFANCCRKNGEWFCCKSNPNCCNVELGRSGGDAPQRAKTA